MPALLAWIGASLIETRVYSIDIFLIQLLLRKTQSFSEALIMHDLALSQKAYHVVYVGVVAEAQYVVVRLTRLLLCCYRTNTTRSKSPVYLYRNVAGSRYASPDVYVVDKNLDRFAREAV